MVSFQIYDNHIIFDSGKQWCKSMNTACVSETRANTVQTHFASIGFRVSYGRQTVRFQSGLRTWTWVQRDFTSQDILVLVRVTQAMFSDRHQKPRFAVSLRVGPWFSARLFFSFGRVKATDGFAVTDGLGQLRKFGYVTLETTKMYGQLLKFLGSFYPFFNKKATKWIDLERSEIEIWRGETRF